MFLWLKTDLTLITTHSRKFSHFVKNEVYETFRMNISIKLVDANTFFQIKNKVVMTINNYVHHLYQSKALFFMEAVPMLGKRRRRC